MSSSKAVQKFLGLATQTARPIQASLELTYRCNERCTHCYIEDFKDDPKRILTEAQWFEVLKKLRQAGTLYLVLMGGEPLLSPHIFSILSEAKALGFYNSMISNGLKIKSLDYAQRLKKSGLHLVTFSVYSLDSQIHDQMTQVRGSHEKLMAAVDYCQQAGVSVSINGLLTEANAPGIFELCDWAIQRKMEIKIDPNVTAKLNGNLSPTRYRASRETLLWFYRERSRRWPASTPQPMSDGQEDYICNAAKGKCAVTPYGELLPCVEIRESFGSLVDEDFDSLWMSATAKKWREPRIQDMDGAPQSLYSFCDHCPGMAKNEHKKAFELTNYTRLVAEVKRQVALEVQYRNQFHAPEI